MRKKILLTGGSGFIGKNIQESFLSAKYEIVAPSHRELDLTDSKEVDDFLHTHTFDAVIHAAAKPGHRNARDHKDLFLTNMRMFNNLIRHADKWERFINIGSGAVYDVTADNRLVREEQIGTHIGTDDHSRCKYAQHKQILETPGAVDLNIFGIFGKYEDWEIRFISNAVCKTLFNLPITLRQNRRFSYLYIDDLMPVVDFFLSHPVNYKCYNVTPDSELELLDAARLVEQVGGKRNGIRVANQGYGLNYSGSNARLKAEIPGLTFTPPQKAIKALFDYYKTNLEQLDKSLLLHDK